MPILVFKSPAPVTTLTFSPLCTQALVASIGLSTTTTTTTTFISTHNIHYNIAPRKIRNWRSKWTLGKYAHFACADIISTPGHEESAHFARSKIIPNMFKTGDKCEAVVVNGVWARAEVIEHKDELFVVRFDSWRSVWNREVTEKEIRECTELPECRKRRGPLNRKVSSICFLGLFRYYLYSLFGSYETLSWTLTCPR